MIGRKRSRKELEVKRSYHPSRSLPRPRYGPRLPLGQCYIKRTVARELWTLNGANVDNFWRYYTATLGQIPSIGELAAVFDQIKVTGVKFTFTPRFSEAAVTSGGFPSVSTGNAHIIVDPTSNVTPSGVYGRNSCNGFLENGAVKTYDYTKTFSVYFKPHVAYRLGGDDFATFKPCPWLNTSTALTTPLRGFHIYLQDSNFAGATGPQWDVFVTYYMIARNLK